jgi:leader peptidase (prepilin peptidase)/N-methyltransferase
VVGSFLNVVIHRLPAGRSVVTPRSACPGCGRPIRWHENVPLLSFALLGGKCRGCRAPISWRYPLVEALTGGLFAAAAWLLVVRVPGGVFVPALYGLLAAALAATGLLVALSFIDLDTMLLPDRLTKPGMALGAVASAALGAAGDPRAFLQDPALVPFATMPDAGACLVLSLAGMGVGYGSLWLVGWLGEKAFRKEAMGLGDAKLLAMVGAFTGPVGALLAAAAGILVGLVMGLAELVRTRSSTFPFGPSLAVGGVAVLLAPGEVREGLRAFALATVTEPLALAGLAAVLGAMLLLLRLRKGEPAD